MKKELFEELFESVKQGGAILRGKMKPSRAFEFPESEVRKIRERYSLSQDKFARLMGISVATLRNWEQGRRKPEGPARILLMIAAKHPEALLDLMTNKKSKKQLNNDMQRTLDSAAGLDPLVPFIHFRDIVLLFVHEDIVAGNHLVVFTLPDRFSSMRPLSDLVTKHMLQKR